MRLACGFDHAGVPLRARVVGPAVAGELVVAFADATFSGEERHARRLAKVQALEDEAWHTRP